ncbi:MAG: DNA polymerase III subunit delta [Clostridiales bacterium]|nr:DNA polymerase III subunit delta [Clostridiales bacterium]
MNHTAFFEQLRAGNIGSVYLMEGSEEYIKQQALSQLCKKLLPEGLEELNMTELRNPDADTLIAAAETLPFMAEKRVVIARECKFLEPSRKKEGGASEGSDKADDIAEYVQRIPPSVCLVFYLKGKADGRRRLYTLLKKQNAIVDFSPMSEGECNAWLRKSMAKMQKNLSPEAAAQMIFTVGRDAAMLRQEMDKLCAYLGQRDTVTAEDIDAICTRSTECTVFQMVDAQVAGKNSEAFVLLRDMLRAGEERMAVLAMLLRQYRILYHLRSLMDEGTPSNQQAALVGISPFFLRNNQQQAKRYSKEKLKQAYDWLLQYEFEIKNGLTPQDGCAETALLRLTEILG